MEQRDFLKRQTDQLGRSLGKTISMLPGLSNYDSAYEWVADIEQMLTDELAIDIDYLVLLPDNDFINELQGNLKFSNENLMQLANTLEGMANTLHENEQGNEEKSKRLFEKCVCIYEYLNSKSNYSLELAWRIKRIKNDQPRM